MKTIEGLTQKQQQVNFETMRHIEMVRNLLSKVVVEILRRAELHDQSKLREPEVQLFSEFTEKLATTTYGSEEYEGCLEAIKPALDHHYAKNRHHPEHFKRGIDDMNLVDLVEMFCDWKSAAARHNDGNLRKSIEINAGRYKIGKQLTRILENSVDLIEEPPK